MSTSYRELWQSLLPHYDEREARAVVLWLLDVAFSLSRTSVVCGAVEQLQGAELQRLQAMMGRLQRGEPVQYVAGLADFGPRQFAVSPSVLIPRPETYELCQWIVAEAGGREGTELRLLDIGTGSGCIACTLALDLPGSEVLACDISTEALSVARANAQRLGATVAFQQMDILQAAAAEVTLSLIVSNPPYICEHQRAAMDAHVTDHEPSMALFVPDSDPLRFYRAIARYGLQALKPGGQLYLELDADHAAATAQLLSATGYDGVELRNDQFGRPRFARCHTRRHS